MAMVHERLYFQKDIEHLDFREYVQTLTQELVSAYEVNPHRVRLRFELEPVSLEMNQAIPGGLIVNELMTNCLKYAFPDARPGEILVGLSCRHDRVTLRIADNGIGLPPGVDWRQPQSLGLQIVNILVRQLKGIVEYKTGCGVEFSLTFPMFSSFPRIATQSPAHPPAQAASHNAGK
jgi:two-component sensor histidine kinase